MTAETQRSLEVAVGIPTGDNAAMIAQTIESLRAQTRVPDRLIIVDDSSYDTGEIITSYADDTWSIDLLDQPRDGVGIGAARAAIYAAFDGDILCCLDTEQVVDDDPLTSRSNAETYPVCAAYTDRSATSCNRDSLSMCSISRGDERLAPQ